MNSLQTRVASFVAENGIKADVAHRLLDAVSELGEVAKEVLKSSNYGAKTFVPSPEFEEELGDVLFSILCVANSTGVDLEAAVENALRKYQRRLAVKGNPGSSNEKA